MKSRCSNPNASRYKNYGGRGITIDPRWMKFENFLADMGPRPANHTLERLDVNLGYFKGNCCWATRLVQARNRSNAKLTMAQVAQIRQLYATGKYTQVSLAKQFCIGKEHIFQILKNKTWK